MISQENFLGKVGRKALATVLAIATLIWAFGLAFIPLPAQATVTPTVTGLINFGNNRVKASSAPAAAIKMAIAVDAAETLVAVTVVATDSGSTSFAPATDLAALTTTTASGIALYNDAGATVGSFDGTDALVSLSGISAFSSGSTTLTLTTPAAAGTFYIVYRTAATPGDTHSFVLTIPATGIATTSVSPIITPVSTTAIIIDTAAPSLSNSAPATGSGNVSITTFLSMNFNENLDPSTLTPANITMTNVTDSNAAVGIGVKSFPNGFNVVVSSKPTYAASSIFSTVTGTSTGLYQIGASGSTIFPQPPTGYVAPTVGDIVFFQHDTFPGEIGLVTDATLTNGAGTFAVNNFTLFGGQQITKFAAPTATGLVTASSTTVALGTLVVANTTANPTSDRYKWHMATTPVSGAAFSGVRLDGAGAPSFVSGSSFSTLAPTDTSAVNGSNAVVGTADSGIDFVVGDLVFANVTANADNLDAYAWHVVTTAQNITTDIAPTTLRLDGNTTGAPTFAASSQVSKLTPGATGLVTETATALNTGDMVFASTTDNASNNGAYNFHLVSNGNTVGDNGAASGVLRFDNVTTPLLTSKQYTVTAGVGIKDQAGNALAAPASISFTTGTTGGTNTTPPAVQASIPQAGNQSFPPNGVIKLTFSVDMSTTGGNSGTNSVTNPANTGLSLDNFGAPGTVVATTNTYDSASRTLTITPTTVMNNGVAADLAVSTGYVVRVLSATQSTNGTGFTNPYFLSFRTASAVDSTAPTVLGVSPANSATGVSRSVAVTAGFSKDINPATLTTTTVTLKKNSDSSLVAGTVTYNSGSRSVTFTPTTLLGDTGTPRAYTLTIKAGSSGVKDVAGNQIGAASPANDYTSAFTVTDAADATQPSVAFSNADTFGVAITFSEQVKSGGGPNAADNIANYTLESPVGSTVSLGGKTVTYDGATRTAKIAGLSLQTSSITPVTYKVTVSNLVQDLANNFILTTGTPPANTAFGTVANSTDTGGQLGPGSGPMNDPGMQGMNPIRVTPMNRATGASSNYKVELMATTNVPLGGQIVLTFPTGFDVTSANKADAGTASFCNSDLNGPLTGVVTIASVAKDIAAGSITITTAGADTGANAFLCMDLTGIGNSTIPSSTGYSVDIKTRDTVAANRAVLQTMTSAPFFLGQAGNGTLTVNVFKDANTNHTNDTGEGINGVTVFLFSPAIGGQEATTALNVVNGVATFSNLSAGDYQVGLKPTSAIDVAFNSAPQPITVAGSGTTTKNFELSTAAAITLGGTIYGPASTKLDVFANSPTGFAKVTVTTNSTPVTVSGTSYGGSVAYSIPVSANTTYNVGIGPSMPESFMTPGAPPPPPPTFNFMPPAPLQVLMGAVSVTGKNFALGSAGKTITGTVVDSNGTGVSTAGVFCRPSETSTTGGSAGFGTGAQTNTAGAFTVNVGPGVYLCGVFKPGMPPVPDKQVTVPASGTNSPSTLAFVLDAGTSLTITGTIKDDSGNAIPYAGVSGRKVTSTSDTTALGGDSSNFVGGPTDANGAYTLYVSAGTWVVEAFAPGFGKLGTKTISISTSSSSGQDFSAQTLTYRTITGTATQSSANVQGVMVRAETSNGSNGNMTSSASDGTYTLKVPDGTYNVSCSFPGVGDITATGGAATVSSGVATIVRNCTVGTPITLTITITDGTNPITGAGIDVRDSNGRGNFTNVSTTAGVYTVSVPPGTYTVRAGHPTYGKIGETTGVTATDSIAYTASAGQTYAVTGTVTGDGTALGSAWVSLIGTPTSGTNTIFLGGQTATDGTFSIAVPSGTYRLRVDKPGYKSPAESTVIVASAAQAAGTIALTTAGKTIGGTISISSSPVSNAFVDASDGNGGYAVAQTNSSGVYSLAVDTGTWTLRAHAPGYEGGPVPVTVAGSNVSDQNISLTAISGFTVKPEKPETVTPTNGGFLTNTDIGANFKLNIPANALGTGSNAATVTTKVNTGMPNPPSGAILSKNAVTISAVDSTGSKVSSLNDSVTIVIPYDEANLPAGTSEANLVIGTWNDATQTYDTLPTTVDTTANTLTTTVTHFSDFAPLVPSGSGAPSTPTGLTVSNTGTGTSVTLNWTAVSGASNYNVYKSTDNSSFPLLANTTGIGYTASGLTSGTTYYFKVSAVNSTSVESAASTAVSGVPSVTTGGGGGGGGAPATTTPTTPTVTTPSSTTGSVTATPTAGGTTSFTPSTSSTPSVNVTVPVNAVSASTTVSVSNTSLASAGITVAPSTAGVTATVGEPYNFTAAAGSTAVSTFSQAVTLTFTYTAAQIPTGASESDLAVFYFNTTTSTWDALTATVNTATNTITVNTTHFTVFIVGIKKAAAGTTPTTTVVTGGAHANGTLVNDNGTFYLIKDGKKIGFRDAKEYASHGYNFGQAVSANAQDKAMPQATFVQKAMEGTLVLDAADNKTVYMIGTGSTKRGFVSSAVFKALGYTFTGLVKINLSDYPTGTPIGDAALAHPDGSLVKDGATIWWLRNNQKTGFETMAVFNTYGFSLSRVVTANASDKALTEGAIVKFRDGTLVNDGGTYYLISDGKRLSFASASDLTAKGYKTSNAISASLAAYTSGGAVQ